MNNSNARMTISMKQSTKDYLVKVAGGERKIGRYLDGLAERGQEMESNNTDTLRLQVIGLSAELNALKAQVQAMDT